MRLRGISAALAAGFLAACGGGSAPAPHVVVNGTTGQIGTGVSGTLSLVVANGTAAASAKRSPKFVSPGALSAGVAINNGTATFADVSAASPLCTTSAGVRTCAIPVGAPAGNAVFAVSLYDAANGGGHLLGSGSNSTMIAAGSPFTVAVGVNPVVAALVSTSPSSTNFSLGTAGSMTITPTFADPAGQTITGSGNVPNFLNPVTVTFSDPHITVSPASLTTPGQSFTLSYDGSPAVASTITTTVKSNGATVATNTIAIPGLVITRYPLGSRFTVDPEQIVAGPDGRLWWIERLTNMIGAINPSTGVISHYPTGLASGGFGIAVGGDGKIYYNDGGCAIGRMDTSGAAAGSATATAPCAFRKMMADQSGNVWVLDTNSTTSRVGYIDTSLAYHLFNTLTPNAFGLSAFLDAIATSADGAVWYTEQSAGKIGRAMSSGVLNEYAVPNTSATVFPIGLARGSDSDMWLVAFGSPGGAGQFFGWFSPVSAPGSILVTEYPNTLDPAVFANMVNIASGSDGNLWIVQGGAAVKLPPAAPQTAVAEFFTDNGQIDAHWAVNGPDGNLWFVGYGSAGGNGFIPTSDSVNKFTPR